MSDLPNPTCHWQCKLCHNGREREDDNVPKECLKAGGQYKGLSCRPAASRKSNAVLAQRALLADGGCLKAVKPLHVSVNEHVFKIRKGQHPLTSTRGAGKSPLTRKELFMACGIGFSEQPTCASESLTLPRHTLISVGLTNGVRIKWLAEYCGTSVAMIEKHDGKYLGGDSDEQLKHLKEPKPEPYPEP